MMPGLIIIEMMDYNQFKLCCNGEWITINQGEFGFMDLTKYYPIFKTIHKMICDVNANTCKMTDK